MNMTPPVNHKTKLPKTILWLYYLPNTFWDVLDNFNDLYVFLWSVSGHLYCPLKSLFIHLGTTMSVENLRTLLVFSACNLWRDNIAWDDAEAIKGTSDSLLAAYLRTKGLGGKGEPAANNGRCNGWQGDVRTLLGCWWWCWCWGERISDVMNRNSHSSFYLSMHNCKDRWTKQLSIPIVLRRAIF